MIWGILYFIQVIEIKPFVLKFQSNFKNQKIKIKIPKYSEYILKVLVFIFEHFLSK